MKQFFNYEEASRILRYPSYNAVKVAVYKGKIKKVSRPNCRKAWIHREEIMRVLQSMLVSAQQAAQMIEKEENEVHEQEKETVTKRAG